MTEIQASAANATGVFRFVCAFTMTMPRPACEATNSPTIAPTTAAVAVILSAESTYGSAFGRRIFTKTFHFGAPKTRPRSSSSSSICVRPTAVLITTGKKPISAAMSTLGTTPYPSQSRKSGATATFGSVLTTTRNGTSARAVVSDHAIATPSATPPRPASAGPVCYATARALADRPPVRAPGPHGHGFRRRAQGARPGGAHVRVPQGQSALQEPVHEGRLPALDPAPPRARLPRVASGRRPRDQGRADHPRSDPAREGKARHRVRELLSRQPALDDARRGDRGVRSLLHEGALRDAEPAAGRAPEPRVPAHVLRPRRAPSCDADRGGIAALGC